MHGKIQPFLFDSCENITVKNCTVTYDRPPYTEALITEAGAEYVKLRLNEHCPCRIEDGRLIPYSDSWENPSLNYKGCFYQIFDKKTRMGCGIGLGIMGNSIELDPNWPFHPVKYIAERDGEDIILKGEHPDYFAPGRVLIISHEKRSISSVFMIDSKDITLENYRILCGCGMGIYSYRTENITLDGVRLTYDESSPSLISNAADAVHTFGTTGHFEIKNCVFEGMIDDAINIHSNFRTVEHADGNVLYTHLASCEWQANDLYRVGDKIAIYRGKTMERAAEYVIEKIEDSEGDLKKFTLDRPLGDHADGDLIENLTTNCSVSFENCLFAKANSHLRLQSRGKILMKNCETELPIMLTGDASFWFEGNPINDLTIENCSFLGNRGFISIESEVLPTEKEPYYHRNLKIIGNTFDVEHPLRGGYADGIVFKGNKNAKDLPMTLVLTNCGSAEADGCLIERKTEEYKTDLTIN